MNTAPIENMKIDSRPHPAGAKGAKLSGKEVAEHAWRARMDPRVREWATKQLAKAGVSEGTKRQWAQAILDAYRNKVPYIPDPVMGEFIAEPAQTLCLDPDGLCIIGGDCDDSTVTILAALMSIGITTMVILSSHKPPYDTPTHVFGAFKDDLGQWVKLDGTAKMPVGQVPPHNKEWWIEPGEAAKERGEGDFVGMTTIKYSGVVGTAGIGVGDRPPLACSVLDYRYPSIR